MKRGIYSTATSAQEFRVCDWWYNVKCENSAEYFDRNLDLMIQVPPPPERELIQTHSHSFTQDQQRNSLSSSSSSSSLGLDLSNLVEDGPSLGPFSSKVSFFKFHWNDKILFLHRLTLACSLQNLAFQTPQERSVYLFNCLQIYPLFLSFTQRRT